MSEKNGNENGLENGNEIKAERNERGQFKRGNPGGPGRGHSKKVAQLEAVEDLIDLIEVAAREGIINATGIDDKIKAAKIALKVAELKKPGESEPVLDPWLAKLIGFLNSLASRYSNKVGKPVSALEMIDLFPQFCDGCDRLGGPALIEEVDDEVKEEN